MSFSFTGILKGFINSLLYLGRQYSDLKLAVVIHTPRPFSSVTLTAYYSGMMSSWFLCFCRLTTHEMLFVRMDIFDWPALYKKVRRGRF